MDRHGNEVHEARSRTMHELRDAGDHWSEHVLENAKAYIMSFVYIVVTVTSGYSLLSGIAYACGLSNELAFHFIRFLDSLIYFYLPQINVIILRLMQGRNLRHRMVGRTVVVADCPVSYLVYVPRFIPCCINSPKHTVGRPGGRGISV